MAFIINFLFIRKIWYKNFFKIRKIWESIDQVLQGSRVQSSKFKVSRSKFCVVVNVKRRTSNVELLKH